MDPKDAEAAKVLSGLMEDALGKNTDPDTLRVRSLPLDQKFEILRELVIGLLGEARKIIADETATADVRERAAGSAYGLLTILGAMGDLVPPKTRS